MNTNHFYHNKTAALLSSIDFPTQSWQYGIDIIPAGSKWEAENSHFGLSIYKYKPCAGTFYEYTIKYPGTK